MTRTAQGRMAGRGLRTPTRVRRWWTVLVVAVLGAATLVWLVPTARPWVPTARTAVPPMGWNDWNADGCAVTEQDIRDAIRQLVATGLRDAGYRTVTVDDCWAAPDRSPAGTLVPDPVRFPHGIAALAALAHRQGLQLGIYSSAGTTTCALAQPGSLGHELVDATTFASWGVDALKYDNCGDTSAYPDSQAGYAARYRVMADALAQVGRTTGHPIVYSICEWGVYLPSQWAGSQANSWRTTFAVLDEWASVMDAFRSTVVLGSSTHPGSWNDPDMLQVGNGGMTDTEYRTQFSLWAMMAAPLTIGTDLGSADAAALDTVGNKALIAVDQDPLGTAATVVRHDGGTYVLSRPLADGSVAVALLNTGTTPARVSNADPFTAAGGSAVRDLWSAAVTTSTGTIAATVPPHGTVVYRVSPSGSRSGTG